MEPQKLKVAFASSEVVPFAKSGGLADVAGALPIELSKLGCDIKVFMPKYYSIDEFNYKLKHLHGVGEILIRVAGTVYPVHIYQGFLPGSEVEVYFVDCPHFFHRRQLYTTDPDEDERFILFSKATIETLQRLQWAPDIFHCNDWQTGLIPLYINDNYGWDKMFRNSASIFTIHNIGYQGKFPYSALDKAEIKKALYFPGGPAEHHDMVNFLKLGIVFSEAINTVSETYAKEILTPEYGAGMDPILNERKDNVYGILNGVDYNVWNPETDKYLPYHYSIKNLSGKLEIKKHLLELLHLPFSQNIPLIGIVSRLANQKGFDLLSESIVSLINLNAQWVILGGGERRYEDLFRSIAYNFPNKVSVSIGYNNELAHLIEAGADMFLMPSRYEPCGLNQIYSLKYGTIPIVRKTGGLADTVRDWNELNAIGIGTGNGFLFEDYNSFALLDAVQRAIYVFPNKPIWSKIQRNGMQKDYSWKMSAEKYLSLYHLVSSKKKKLPTK